MDAKRSLAVILAVAALTAASCSNPTGEETPPALLSGTFALVEVDGQPLPVDVTQNGVTIRILSGTMSFDGQGTCTGRSRFVGPGGVEETREVTASYTAEGSRITMVWVGAGTTIGTLSGNTFAMDNAGLEMVYERTP